MKLWAGEGEAGMLMEVRVYGIQIWKVGEEGKTVMLQLHHHLKTHGKDK